MSEYMLTLLNYAHSFSGGSVEAAISVQFSGATSSVVPHVPFGGAFVGQRILAWLVQFDLSQQDDCR